jgi:hypothetical protein
LLRGFAEGDFLGGTLAPERRASESPIAIACARLFTRLPDRPLFSVPFFRLFIALRTFSEAVLLYLAIVVPPSREFAGLRSAYYDFLSP